MYVYVCVWVNQCTPVCVLSMYVFIQVFLCVCVCACVRMCVSVCVCICCTCVCMCVRVHILCMCVCVCMCMCMRGHVCVCVCVCVCVFVLCLYVFIYAFVCKSLYKYIYACLQLMYFKYHCGLCFILSLGICHCSKPLYGVQFHPEVDLTKNGMTVLRNFLYNISGCSGTFTVKSREQECIDYIKERIGNGKVLVRELIPCPDI